MKKLVLLLMVLFVCLAPAVSSAEITYGSHVSGLYTSFVISGGTTGIVSAGAVKFDPTSQVGGVYNRVYILNATASNTLRGLYSADIVAGTYSDVLALNHAEGDATLDSPTGLTVDSSGSAYVCYGNYPSVWKVTTPSGTPTETQMLGNYGDTGLDDDPGYVGMVPTGFGRGTAGSDLLMIDNDFDAIGSEQAVVLINAASTVAEPDYSVVWTDGAAALENTVRAAASDYDGYLYLTTWNVHTADLGGNTRAYVYRMNGAGTLERVFLDIDPAMIPTLNLDDAIAVNQADGSVWMIMKWATGNTRTIYRLDAGNASLVEGTTTDYLAGCTAEITGYVGNIYTDAMGFSPDGKMLAIADAGTDTLTVFNIPEPATIALLVSGSLMFIKRRRN